MEDCVIACKTEQPIAVSFAATIISMALNHHGYDANYKKLIETTIFEHIFSVRKNTWNSPGVATWNALRNDMS